MEKLRKIILVDDDEIIGLVSKRLLEQMQIAEEVLIYSDSLRGLSYLQEHYLGAAAQAEKEATDLVLLDIEMPGMGGFQIMDKLKEALHKKQQVLQQVCFVIITSHKGDKEIEQARACGAYGIMEKPLRISEIERIVADFKSSDVPHQLGS